MHLENEEKLMKMLKNYDYFKSSIYYLKENINDIIEGGMGISYSNDIISKTNKINSVVEIAVIKIDKLDITKNIKSMQNTVDSIEAALNSLSELERLVINKRCIKGEYYYQFIHLACVSERTAKRIKRIALHKMAIIVFGKCT
jgi:hypothetical protein